MSKTADLKRIHQREEAFHNAWAAHVDLRTIRVGELFDSPVAMENRYILSRMGTLKGARILDVGSGLGESSIYFALQGADVTACDISPGMVEVSQKLAKKCGVTIRGVVSTAETLCVPAGSFDFVYAANLIHHLLDRGTFYENAKRALKPGGRFFSWDPLAYNPAIKVYRAKATEVRSDDESPLTAVDWKQFQACFDRTRHREFWIASLTLFGKYFFIDRVHPNADRYWKRIFKETPRSLWWWYPFRWSDEVFTRIPGLRWLAWNTVFEGTRT
jgi:SAM-dependent methyltransferase